MLQEEVKQGWRLILPQTLEDLTREIGSGLCIPRFTDPILVRSHSFTGTNACISWRIHYFVCTGWSLRDSQWLSGDGNKKEEQQQQQQRVMGYQHWTPR
jgi:hypothetical protein